MSNHEKNLAIETRHLCLIRLSSIGDVIHTLPIINTLRSMRPQTHPTPVSYTHLTLPTILLV